MFIAGIEVDIIYTNLFACSEEKGSMPSKRYVTTCVYVIDMHAETPNYSLNSKVCFKASPHTSTIPY